MLQLLSTASWPHCVRCGPSSPQRGTAAPQFSAYVCCGHTAGWIKTRPQPWLCPWTPLGDFGLQTPYFRPRSKNLSNPALIHMHTTDLLLICSTWTTKCMLGNMVRPTVMSGKHFVYRSGNPVLQVCNEATSMQSN